MKRVLLVLVVGASLMLGGCAIGVRPAGYYSGGYYDGRPVVVQPTPYYVPRRPVVVQPTPVYTPPQTIYQIERRIEIRPRSRPDRHSDRHYRHYDHRR